MSDALAPEAVAVLERLAAGIEEHNRRERAATANDPMLHAEVEARRRPLHKPRYLHGHVLLHVARQGVKVPDDYCSIVGAGIEIACPCGQKPHCEGVGPVMCACGRAYARVSGDILVLFSPVARDKTPPG